MVKQVIKVNKIRVVANFPSSLKKFNKIFQVAKKCHFLKDEAISSAQFLGCPVRHSPAQTLRSDASRSAHQHGKASGIVDGSFHIGFVLTLYQEVIAINKTKAPTDAQKTMQRVEGRNMQER